MTLIPIVSWLPMRQPRSLFPTKQTHPCLFGLEQKWVQPQSVVGNKNALDWARFCSNVRRQPRYGQSPCKDQFHD